MIDKDKREEELSNLIYGCPIDCLNPAQEEDIKEIVSQEQFMIEKLEADKAEWISVKDELPKQEYEKLKYYSRRIHYVVCLKNKNVLVADFNFESHDGKIKNYFRPISYPRILKNVTHWMPLPKSPKDGEIK